MSPSYPHHSTHATMWPAFGHESTRDWRSASRAVRSTVMRALLYGVSTPPHWRMANSSRWNASGRSRYLSLSFALLGFDCPSFPLKLFMALLACNNAPCLPCPLFWMFKVVRKISTYRCKGDFQTEPCVSGHSFRQRKLRRLLCPLRARAVTL